MDLRNSLAVVWDDVADSVYQLPTIHEAVRYAREEISSDELDAVREYDVRDGTDVYAAYLAVRNAPRVDVDAAVAELV